MMPQPAQQAGRIEVETVCGCERRALRGYSRLAIQNASDQ